MCFRLAPVFQRARIAEDETHRAVLHLVSTIRISNHEACCNLLDVVVDLDRLSGLGGGPRYDRCPEAGRTARGFFVPAYASRSSDFETVPRKRLGAGITRQTIHNANSTIAKWVFAKNAVIPLQHHLNEQITWITAGSVKCSRRASTLWYPPGKSSYFPRMSRTNPGHWKMVRSTSTFSRRHGQLHQTGCPKSPMRAGDGVGHVGPACVVDALFPLDGVDELLAFVAILAQCLLLKHAVRKGVGAAHKAKSLASPLIPLVGEVFQRIDHRTSLQSDKRYQETKNSFIHEALR